MKTLNKQQQDAGALLLEYGVPIEKATSLALTYEPDRIRNQITWLRERLTQPAVGAPIVNPVGYLIRAIEQNYAAPRSGQPATVVVEPVSVAYAVPDTAPDADTAPSGFRTKFEALPVKRQRELWDAAVQQVKHKLGLQAAPEPLVWGYVYDNLESAATTATGGEQQAWDRLAALPCPVDALSTRLVAWATNEGLVPKADARTRDAVRARQTLWLILKHLGIGQRRIAQLCSAKRTTVRAALQSVTNDDSTEREAVAWANRFLDAWEMFGR